MPPTIDEIHAELCRLADDLGRTPTTEDIQEHDALLLDHVRRVCGGVPQAQVGAGLRPTSARGLTDDAVLDEVRAVADDLGRMPKRDEFDDHSGISSSTVRDRLGLTWQEVAERLGYEPNRHLELSRDAVVADLRRVGDELGRRPEKREAVENGRYSEWAYTRQFAPYSDLVREAGFVVGDPNSYDYDDPDFVADVEADVRRIADELGRVPTRKEMGEHGKYSEWVYRKVHGGWSELLRRTDLAEA